MPISAGGVDIDVYADYMFSQVGRGLTMLMVGSAYTEPDEELRATLAAGIHAAPSPMPLSTCGSCARGAPRST